MVLKTDKERLQTLVAETVTLLCKNGLNFKAEFCLEALVGITLDKDQEFHFSIKQTIKTDRPSPSPEEEEELSDGEEQEQDSKAGLQSVVQQQRFVNIKKSASDSRGGTPKNGETTGGLPSLSFEDMGEGSGDYWSSVTGDEDVGGGGSSNRKRKSNQDSSAPDYDHTPVKRSIKTPVSIKENPESDDDSDLVVIKDEPYSGEEDTSYSYQDSSQSNPVFSNITTGDSHLVPISMHAASNAQLWGENLQQSFGDPSASATSQQPGDPQQIPSLRWMHKTDSRFDGQQIAIKTSPYTDWDLCRRILLCKRFKMTPREYVNGCFSSKCRPPLQQVKDSMAELGQKGLGYLFMPHQGRGLVFFKRDPQEVKNGLDEYRISLTEYENVYNVSCVMHDMTGTAKVQPKSCI